MPELDLYKFIYENELEIGWRGKELVLWIDFYYLKDFTKLLGYNFLCEGLEVILQENCIAIDIVDICEYFDINPTDILKLEEQNG